MANLIGHRAWASCGEVIEDYDDNCRLVKCLEKVFTVDKNGAGDIATYTEINPYAIVEHGIVRYFETEEEARKYAHEHALDLKKSFKKG